MLLYIMADLVGSKFLLQLKKKKKEACFMFLLVHWWRYQLQTIAREQMGGEWGDNGKRAIWISRATLQSFNNRINVASGAAVPVGKGSIGKRQKYIKKIID